MELALTILVAVAVIIALTNAWYELRLKAPPIPSVPWVRKVIIELIPPGDGLIVELGSGCGGLARRIGKKFPARSVVGYEISLFPYLCCRLLQALGGPGNLEFRRADIFNVSLNNATAVVFYLTPAVLRRLAGKLVPELPAGTTVISSSFPLPGWEPVQTVTVTGPWTTPIYVYRTPASMVVGEVAALTPRRSPAMHP